MWLFFSITAIITAVLNIVWTLKGLDAKWFRFISLSFTAFTLCAFYTQVYQWILIEDWSALYDVVPTISKGLWFLTILSIAINSISLFKNSNTQCLFFPMPNKSDLDASLILYGRLFKYLVELPRSLISNSPSYKVVPA